MVVLPPQSHVLSINPQSAAMNIRRIGFISSIIFVLAGCNTTIHPVSERGKLVCREQAAELPPGTAIQSRQEAYRLCLASIESELARTDAKESLQRQSDFKLAKEQQENQQRIWVPPQQRLSYCLLNRDNVIDAEKRRIRALGPKMMADQTPTMSADEKQRRLDEYNQIIRELNQLLPESIRAGLPLIPDAVRVFSNCDSKSFSP